MPRWTPEQVRLRERFEGLIGVLEPALDLVLAAGDRISRIAGPEDDYYPIRPGGEAFKLEPPPAQAREEEREPVQAEPVDAESESA
jgi:hypothetical protein